MPETTPKPDLSKRRSPWTWIPSLYFAEGLPFVVISALSVIMYKNLGVSLGDIAFYTSWLYLPWVIKPLWSPLVEIFRTKRFWIIAMQLIMGAGFALVAFSIPMPCFFQVTLAFFWLLAFNSATHDIAADGFYMLVLDTHDQAWFVGIRSFFYRVATIAGQGLLVMLAGFIESYTGLDPVGINISAVPNESAEVRQWISPEKIPPPKADEKSPLRIVLIPGNELTIPIGGQSTDELAFLQSTAKEWNKKNSEAKKDAGTPKPVGTESAWTNNVTKPLEEWIRKVANAKPREKTAQAKGNVGVVYMRLSKAPEEGKIVSAQFGRKSGSKDISLLEECRVEFNASNWDRPQMLLVQLDPKLKDAAYAVFQARAGNVKIAWAISLGLLAVLLLILGFYHLAILPHPDADVSGHSSRSWLFDFGDVFASFFGKEGILAALAFLLLYRLGEAQLLKVAAPFLMDAQENGGLGLSTMQVGFTYGTLGVIMLMAGGLLGGWIIARFGLRSCLWWMAIAIHLPDLLFIFLASTLPTSQILINMAVGLEQFGYGFGFTAYMLFMVYFAEGRYKTAHYAIMTGFMAMGMMFPGMISGWLQEILGYPKFFTWVILATIPSFVTLLFLKIDPSFGKKRDSAASPATD